MLNEAFRKKYNYNPEYGAHSAYLQVAMWADAVERAGSFYPPDVIKAYEAGAKLQSPVGEVYFRGADHQLVRPVIIIRGKKPSAITWSRWQSTPTSWRRSRSRSRPSSPNRRRRPYA